MDSFERKGFEHEIARTRSELVILRRALDESLSSRKTCGLIAVHNPITVSLRRDIEEHEVLLQRSERELTHMAY